MDNMQNNGPELNQEQQNNQQVPPQFNQTINVQVPPQGYAPKSKVAAGLLGIFLGAFGVHNFYLGYTGKAVAQLVLTIVGIALSCLIFGIFIVAAVEIWGLIEGIMILTGAIAVDGKGFPLQQ